MVSKFFYKVLGRKILINTQFFINRLHLRFYFFYIVTKKNLYQINAIL